MLQIKRIYDKPDAGLYAAAANMDEVFRQIFIRPVDSHKYNFGHVLVVGGSPGMVGAPLLAGKAALRTGAGLVTIAATSAVTDKLEKRVEEIMSLALPDSGSEAGDKLLQFIKERKVSVVVLGPGWQASDTNSELIQNILQNVELPLLIDGGALNILKEHLILLKNKVVILTPHLGEFKRLVDVELPKVRTQLKPIAVKFAQDHSVTLVLKGEPTFVAQPNGQVYENTTGNPGLATAGTGDVLSGIIAGLISQGIEPRQASEAGVYLHGLAGDLATAAKTQPGMIASDVIKTIPAALKIIQKALL